MKLSYRTTMLACYNGYITQAICINLAPLLYLTFQRDFGLSLGQVSLLITCNFSTQLAVDLLASRFADRLPLRAFTVGAHCAATAGLIGLSVLPSLLPPLTGLLLAVALLGVGGGLIEVIISPLIEACPTEGKSGNMSFLHSFYSWGQAGVVLLSGLFFRLFELDRYWRILPCLWALIPFAGAVAFCFVPVYRLTPQTDGKKPAKEQIFSRAFLGFLIMMLCAGAAEQVMSQWASGFVESALGVNKALGDLLGPCMFALMMGFARLFYGKNSGKIRLEPLMAICCVSCSVAYLLSAFIPFPPLALAGCALCGLSVGVFWPGILSRAAEQLPGIGMSMFAMLALAGDVGCLVGPSAAGVIASLSGGNLRTAFVFALIFPLGMLLILWLQKKRKKKATPSRSDGAVPPERKGVPEGNDDIDCSPSRTK